MAKVIWKGWAKPDDPIYKEGYSIHIGPLLGTVPTIPKQESKSTNPPSDSKKRTRKRK